MNRNFISGSIAATLLILISMGSCKQRPHDYAEILHNPALYNNIEHQLNYVIIFDIFSPPVASRVFAYSNLAAYEVLAHEGHHFISLAGKVMGLQHIPSPATGSAIDYPFASMIAFLKVGNQLTFSSDTMRILTDSLKALARDHGMGSEMFASSVAYGNQVADSVIAWSKKDNYDKTRGSSFTVTGLPGHWEPTPPGYFEAVEPLWNTLRPMVLDSANMFPPPPPVTFSTERGSGFYKAAKEVMDTVGALDTTQKWIANFWDCNSFKLHVEGHAMYATKAMTPPGHWTEIVGTICRNNQADFYKTVYAYTGATIGMYDAFICCWYTKYKYDLIRPETYINKYISQQWRPYLQTPPFPEYNSAHSTISAAAATVLASIFPGRTEFRDSSERNWGWPDRTFQNADDAAWEVSLSRFYGGIHYRKSVSTAYDQGKKIGNLVLNKLTSKPI